MQIALAAGVAVMLQATAVPPGLTPSTEPSAEAIALATELAGFGMLATIAPTLVERDIAELATEGRLSAQERMNLEALGRDQGTALLTRVNIAMGRTLASRLSLADLRALVAFQRTPAAARLRAVQPAALIETMAGVGDTDLKKAIAAAYCTRTGKLCARD